MSKKEKESFDLKNYLIFFKKFFINLAIYSSLIFLMFYIVFDESTASIAYFISVLLPMPPNISFAVVINGPVAIAGSIPFLFKICRNIFIRYCVFIN